MGNASKVFNISLNSKVYRSVERKELSLSRGFKVIVVTLLFWSLWSCQLLKNRDESSSLKHTAGELRQNPKAEMWMAVPEDR
jgi:hypothetical protein